MGFYRVSVRVVVAGLLMTALIVATAPATATAGHADTSPSIGRLDLVAPAGSEHFGQHVVVLTNGNYVVTDPGWSSDTLSDVGAVYLYDGATNTVISTLTGTESGDAVGLGGGVNTDVGVRVGVTSLPNGDYVVSSPEWNGGSNEIGAVTLVNGVTGIDGPVTTLNSLHGGDSGDQVGSGGVTVLPNGDYVVSSPEWDVANTDSDARGAVTLVDGELGMFEPVTALNSLHGAISNDRVGGGGVTALSNGNYVVSSPDWRYGDLPNAGAATFVDVATGPTSGEVTTINSLHGTTHLDHVGSEGVTPLSNGNYVVSSPEWDDVEFGKVDVGAVTFVDVATDSRFGAVDIEDSLHGTTAEDRVGSQGVTALSNGNYVVVSPEWDDDEFGTVDVGAVTFVDVASGLTSGTVTIGNSLHGSTAADQVGRQEVAALPNGDYVVSSAYWDDPDSVTADVGAVTFVDVASGLTSGEVTTTNSLHGTTAAHSVGSEGVTVLSNGNYVVNSPGWDDDELGTDVGAVTFVDSTNGPRSGPITTANSLYGTHDNDRVGRNRVTALSNGNYVVSSSDWHYGEVSSAGAVTFGNGTTGVIGPVTTDNSLHGTEEDDSIGLGGVVALASGGNFIAMSLSFGTSLEDGAVTFGLGDVPTVGPVTSSNSVVGAPPGLFRWPLSGRLTSGEAVPVSTTQDGVVLMLVDSGPSFVATPADVHATTVGGAEAVVVSYPVPEAEDRRSTPTVVCTPGSGSDFSVGTTGVVCVATDSAGLTSTTGFDVVVAGSDAPDPKIPTPDFVSLSPARLLDSRVGQTTVDGLFGGDGIHAAGSTSELTVAGRGGVPADAAAVALNVTAANTVSRGYVTAFPCDQDRPTASNLNAVPGVVVPNSVIAPLDSDGNLCLYNHSETDLIVDLAGYFPHATTFTPSNPARLLDSRAGQTTVDGQESGGGATSAQEVIELQVTGRAGVPAGATAVAVNLTLTRTSQQMYATMYPCGTARPDASSINAAAGATIANSALAKLSGGGKLCIYTHASTDLVLDVVGWFTTNSEYVPLTPARVLETRAGGTTVDGQSLGAGLRPAGTTTILKIVNRGGAPSSLATVVLNVTVTGTVSSGFITAYPCGEDRPNASNLNFGVGSTVANNVIVKVSATGTVCLYNHQATHLIADISGYFPN